MKQRECTADCWLHPVSQTVHLSANNTVLKVRQPTRGQQYFTVITAARQTPLYNIIHTHTAQLREMLSVQSNTTYVVVIHRYTIHNGTDIQNNFMEHSPS